MKHNTEELAKRLADSEAMVETLLSLLDATDVFIALLTSDGTTLLCNKAIADSLGVEKESLKGKPLFSMMDPETANRRSRRLRECIARGEIIHFEDERAGRFFHSSFAPAGRGMALIVARDITIEKVSQQAVGESEERYRMLVQTSHDVIFTIDRDGNFTFTNQAFTNLFGYTSEEAKTINSFSLIHPDDTHYVRARFGHMLKGNRAENVEYRARTRSGEYIHLLMNTNPVLDADGRVAGVTGISRNMTDLKKAQLSLVESEEKYRTLVENARMALARLDLEGNFIYVNRAFLDLMGLTWKQLTENHDAPEGLGASPEEIHAIIDKGGKSSTEVKIVRPDGSMIWVSKTAYPWYTADGAPGGIETVGFDITERKLAEEAAHESELRYRTLLETTRTGLVILDSKGLVAEANTEYVRLTGLNSLKDILGRSVVEWTAPYDVERNAAEVAKCFEKGYVHELEIDYIAPDGGITPIEVNATVFGSGEDRLVLSLCKDITERKLAEEALKTSEEQFRMTFENARDAIFWADPETGLLLRCNKSAEMLLERPWNDIVGRNQLFLHPPEEVEHYSAMFKEHIGEGVSMDAEAEVVTSNGARVPVHISASVVRIGDKVIIQGIFRDIAILRKAEEEREALREQLLQSQKMEAIGQLAGGIAHDFNNMLSIIIGNAQLGSKTAMTEPSMKKFRKILSASERARELTMKLLTFARREMLEVKAVNVNAVIEELISVAGRGIPKKIQLVRQLAENLRPVRADANQIHQALLNIVNNACDAMPDGGILGIETQAAAMERSMPTGVEPGKFCLIRIADTGGGIPRDIEQKIFDPFFTTKEAGKGTGLGLSITFGIIKNHGGHIVTENNSGGGTIFKIYLPWATEGCEAEDTAASEMLEGGRETILVVDDEPDVLEMASEILTDAGYRVLPAKNGSEAIDIFSRKGGEIDLVVLDMVMPEMDGRDVFMRLKELDPEVKVILASGYSIEGQASKLLREGIEMFLQKPYSIYDFCAAVRQTIDS